MLLSIPSAARELGLGVSTVRKLIRYGDLSVLRVRRRVLIHPDAVEAFIRRHVLKERMRRRTRER